MNVILAAFMKRFPGVTVDHIDATPDKLLARIVSEARGGRVLADVYGGSLAYVAQLSEQQLLVPLADIKEFPTNEKLWKEIFQIR